MLFYFEALSLVVPLIAIYRASTGTRTNSFHIADLEVTAKDASLFFPQPELSGVLYLFHHIQTKIAEPLALWMLKCTALFLRFVWDYGTSLMNVLLMQHAQSLTLLTCSFLIGLPSLSSGTLIMNKNLILIFTLRLYLVHHLAHLIPILLIVTYRFSFASVSAADRVFSFKHT